MPKRGEKARKLNALESGKNVRPPKKWFDKVRRSVKRQYPTYGQKRINQITGGIWHKMKRSSKIRIVKKYQK